jgi:putative flippase GtrA
MNTFKILIEKLFKFAIVGLSGIVVDFSITWLLKEKIKLNKYISNTIGFSVAVTTNFFLNYIWTFKNSNSNITADFQIFFIIAIVGLLLNNLFIYLMHGIKKYNFYLAKATAVILVFAWNFTANYFFNFHAVSK